MTHSLPDQSGWSGCNCGSRISPFGAPTIHSSPTQWTSDSSDLDVRSWRRESSSFLFPRSAWWKRDEADGLLWSRGIKIELLMKVERSRLPVSTCVCCCWGGTMQRLGQEVSGNVLVPCAYLFTIIPAFAATPTLSASSPCSWRQQVCDFVLTVWLLPQRTQFRISDHRFDIHGGASGGCLKEVPKKNW